MRASMERSMVRDSPGKRRQRPPLIPPVRVSSGSLAPLSQAAASPRLPTAGSASLCLAAVVGGRVGVSPPRWFTEGWVARVSCGHSWRVSWQRWACRQAARGPSGSAGRSWRRESTSWARRCRAPAPRSSTSTRCKIRNAEFNGSSRLSGCACVQRAIVDNRSKSDRLRHPSARCMMFKGRSRRTMSPEASRAARAPPWSGRTGSARSAVAQPPLRVAPSPVSAPALHQWRFSAMPQVANRNNSSLARRTETGP
jgi:hypothetical protein